MFKALKDKLFSFRKKVESSVDEKALDPSDDSSTLPVDIPERSDPNLVGQTKTEPVKEQKPEKSKIGFTKKVVSFVRDHELVISEKDIEGPLNDLEIGLLESDVAFSATEAILTGIKEELSSSKRKIGTSVNSVILDALSKALYSVLGEGVDLCEFIRTHEKPVKILFTGVNGTGKTTSVAKVAFYLRSQGFSVVMGAGDTFRAGAIEQLDVHGQRLGIKVIQHQDGSDPTSVLYDTVEYAKAHSIDVVLGDTAGRFHNRANLMNQLAKIRRVINPDMIVYVDEATAGNDAVIRAEEFSSSVGMDAVILTKVDMDPKGGAAISIAHAVGKPLLFIGTGQGYEDLTPFSPKNVVADLLSTDGDN